MNTTSTHFVQTMPGSTADPSNPFTETTTTGGDWRLLNPAPTDHGVCPSCGRCRECGRGPSEWDRYLMRPWWQREWTPPYQITWTYNPNDAPWAVY